MGSKLWSFALALSLLGCASSAFRGPEQGGAQWLDARSKHFRLLTTQPERKAQATLQLLEGTQAFFEEIAFPSTENPPGATEVVVLPAEEFDALKDAEAIHPMAIGYFQNAGHRYAQRPRLVVRAEVGEQARQILQHELTHRFVAFHCPNAPTWLNEGLARFWESLELQNSIAIFGGAVRVKAGVNATPLSELLELYGNEFYEGDELRVASNYAAAGALAHILYFEHRPILTAYLNALKSGQVSARHAWGKAVGEDLLAINGAFDALLTAGSTQGRVTVSPVRADAIIDPLPDDEVHLLWASLWPIEERYGSHVRRELEATLALAPESPEALLERGMLTRRSGNDAAARRDVERALELGPRRALVLAGALAFALDTKQELRTSNATLAQRLLKAPAKAPQLSLLASYYGSIGRFDRGISLAAHAVRLDSSCVDCYVIGSELLAAHGDLQAAIDARRAAIALSGEDVTPAARQRLQELEQRLAQQSAAPPPAAP